MSDTLQKYDDLPSLARQLWEAAGRPAGRDLEFWLQAEEELNSPPIKSLRVQGSQRKALARDHDETKRRGRRSATPKLKHRRERLDDRFTQ
jgi:hypothetical protein